jgi:biopolymer transport protein ExbD
MSGVLSSESRVEPNLTPILDLVFQLITFFMLVINFKSATMDLSLRLPVIGSVRPVALKATDLLVLNVDRQGELRVYGKQIADVPSYIAGEAQASLLAARRLNPQFQPGDDLPTMVVLRADKKTPFKHLNRVIVACQQNGFRQFSLRALNRKEES